MRLMRLHGDGNLILEKATFFDLNMKSQEY